MTRSLSNWRVSIIGQHQIGVLCALSNVSLGCRNRVAPLSETGMIPDVGCAGPPRCGMTSPSPTVVRAIARSAVRPGEAIRPDLVTKEDRLLLRSCRVGRGRARIRSHGGWTEVGECG